jgi:hypothetical protein
LATGRRAFLNAAEDRDGALARRQSRPVRVRHADDEVRRNHYGRTATAGDFICKPPGESHTLVAYDSGAGCSAVLRRRQEKPCALKSSGTRSRAMCQLTAGCGQSGKPCDKRLACTRDLRINSQGINESINPVFVSGTTRVVRVAVPVCRYSLQTQEQITIGSGRCDADFLSC